MGKLRLAILCIMICSGCQTTQLQHATEDQARTVNELYYGQILSNIAMLHDHSDRLPYFSLPDTGQNTTQVAVTLNYTLSADLLATTNVIAKYIGKYVFDKQSAFITGADTNIETWNTKLTRNPDQIILMSYAYEIAFGIDDPKHKSELFKVLDHNPHKIKIMTDKEIDAKVKEDLQDLPPDKKQKKAEDLRKDLQAQRAKLENELRALPNLAQFHVNYSERLHSGWFGVGTRHEIPKNACYVARYGRTYAWVIPGHERAVGDFALVILDITTYQSPDRQPSLPPLGTAGRAR